MASSGLGSLLLPSRVALTSFPCTLKGITVWLPWCTMDSACGLTTLSMTASPSTTQQVSLGLPLSCQHRVSLGAPLFYSRNMGAQIGVQIQSGHCHHLLSASGDMRCLLSVEVVSIDTYGIAARL